MKHVIIDIKDREKRRETMSRTEAQKLSRIEVEIQGAKYQVVRVKAGYRVIGEAPHGQYLVQDSRCECKGYQHRGYCRHLECIRLALHKVAVLRHRSILVFGRVKVAV